MLENDLLTLDRQGVVNLVEKAFSDMTPLEVAEHVVAPALRRIGQGWQEGKVALAQVYMAGSICDEIISNALPKTTPIEHQEPRLAVANLEDYHSLGLKIVTSMLRATGFHVKEYGRQDVRSLGELVKRDQINILFVSTLMLRSALRVKELRRYLKSLGCELKLVVGGAPFLFDPVLYEKVGADLMGKDASEAVTIAFSLSGGD
ncbi:MAG: B12-binding domain-containing protein [Methanomassiliicoccales archaeon]